MKPSPSPPRTPSRLSDSIRDQLNMYALAASAAGVGMLALAQPAEAKIVYTPAHKWFPINQWYCLDLNHDGKADFKFYHGSFHSTATFFSAHSLKVAGFAHNVIEGAHGSAAVLYRGAKVGPGNVWTNPALMYRRGDADSGTFSTGQWGHVAEAYLGFRFIIKGKVHYGWARIYPPVLTGYAYETIANKAIIAGKTKGPDVMTVRPETSHGSLGRLALGRK